MIDAGTFLVMQAVLRDGPYLFVIAIGAGWCLRAALAAWLLKLQRGS